MRIISQNPLTIRINRYLLSIKVIINNLMVYIIWSCVRNNCLMTNKSGWGNKTIGARLIVLVTIIRLIVIIAVICAVPVVTIVRLVAVVIIFGDKTNLSQIIVVKILLQLDFILIGINHHISIHSLSTSVDPLSRLGLFRGFHPKTEYFILGSFVPLVVFRNRVVAFNQSLLSCKVL